MKEAEKYIEEEEGPSRRLSGRMDLFITAVAVLMSLIHLYAAVGVIMTQILRAIHVMFVLFLCFLVFATVLRREEIKGPSPIPESVEKVVTDPVKGSPQRGHKGNLVFRVRNRRKEIKEVEDLFRFLEPSPTRNFIRDAMGFKGPCIDRKVFLVTEEDHEVPGSGGLRFSISPLFVCPDNL